MRDEQLYVLDELTGLVHDYTGVGLSKTLHCGCPDEHADVLQESMESDRLVMISHAMLEQGVWERAPCLQEDDE